MDGATAVTVSRAPIVRRWLVAHTLLSDAPDGEWCRRPAPPPTFPTDGASMSFVNRRRHERYVVTERVVVVIEARKELHTGTLVNLCVSGCYVATSGTLPAGERLVLLVSLPGSSERSLRFASMIAWRNDGQAVFAREGYGLEFLHDPRTLRNARELLRELGARGALVQITP